MSVTHVMGDVHVVDPHLHGTPGSLALYVVDAPEPLVVDAGAVDSVGSIYDALAALDIAREEVAHLLLSHVHLDHAAGAGHLADGLPNATVHVHDSGAPYLTEAEALERLVRSVDRATGGQRVFGDPELVPAERCRLLSGGERIDLGDRALEVIDAPGHAPHHVAAFDPDTEGLFAIDAVGMRLDGRLYPTTPPPGFDLEANLDTVDRLRAYDPARVLYGHFGPGSDDPVRELDRYEWLLPAWVDLVEARRAEVSAGRAEDRREGDGNGGGEGNADEDADGMEHGGSGDEEEVVAAIVDTLEANWLSPTVHRDVAGVLHYLDRH